MVSEVSDIEQASRDSFVFIVDIDCFQKIRICGIVRT
jgi:hypothetical protein